MSRWSCSQAYFLIKALSLSPSSGLSRLLTELVWSGGSGCCGLEEGFVTWAQFCTSCLAQLKDASSFYTPMKIHSIFQFPKGSNACLQKATVTFAARTHLCWLDCQKNILSSCLSEYGSPFVTWVHLGLIYGVNKSLIDVVGISNPHFRWLQAIH